MPESDVTVVQFSFITNSEETAMLCADKHIIPISDSGIDWERKAYAHIIDLHLAVEFIQTTKETENVIHFRGTGS